jgi:hypothetical protein
MSGSLSTNYFEAVEITSITQTRISETLSNKSHKRSVGGQRWMLQLSSKNLTQAEMSELYAFLVRQNGPFGHFTIVPPKHGSTRSTNATGAPTVTTDYAAGVTSIRAQGGGGSLLSGDFIKFSNHDKVYMIVEDVNQDLSSEDYFEIFPALNTAIDNTTTIQYNSVPFKVHLESDRTAFKTGTDGTYKIEFSVGEDI